MFNLCNLISLGEMMGMISATPKHLYKIGLLEELVEDQEVDLNFLMSQALITISTLPYHLVNDLWRWRLFAGQVRLRDFFQGTYGIHDTFAIVQ